MVTSHPLDASESAMFFLAPKSRRATLSPFPPKSFAVEMGRPSVKVSAPFKNVFSFHQRSNYLPIYKL